MCEAAALELLAEAIPLARKSRARSGIACLQSRSLSQRAVLQGAGNLLPCLNVTPTLLPGAHRISAGLGGALQDVSWWLWVCCARHAAGSCAA